MSTVYDGSFKAINQWDGPYWYHLTVESHDPIPQSKFDALKDPIEGGQEEIADILSARFEGCIVTVSVSYGETNVRSKRQA